MSKKYNYPRTKVKVSDEAKKAVHQVLESGNYIKGEENKLLAKEFTNYCGAKAGVPVSSGSIALFVALKMANLQPGDEVITVPNTFIATVNAIILAGGKPKFVDIDPNTFNMDPNKLKESITDKTKIIIPVHLYGLLAPMDEILEITQEKNLTVIEDACQAHGGSINGKKAGSWGDYAVFSFYPTKVLNTTGDGGFLISNKENESEKLNQIINHGRKSQYEYNTFGFNFRLSEIQAAVIRAHLKDLDTEINKRNKIASNYTKRLQDISEISPPYTSDNYFHSYYLYTVKAERRNELRSHLNDKGIGSSIEYPVVLHQLEFVKKHLADKNTKFINSETCLDQIISLPMYTKLTKNDIDNIVNEISIFYKS